MTTTTSLRSRLLILSSVPAAAAISLRFRPPAASPSLSSRRRTLCLTTRAAPPGGAVAPASAPAEANEEKWEGGGGMSAADAERLVGLLRADLTHLFDDVGIDRAAYDDRVRFRDPITRHDTIDGYLFNIRLLKLLFRPDFYLHAVKQGRTRSPQDGPW
uniref:Uncharacterized protein n=1 Tax=Arundo donax TaxID=35708 RepID=A0A0A9D7Q0_ARUDO